MAKTYDNESLRSQSEHEAVRMYPNVYLGDSGIGGSTQTFKEILSNAVDEANSGFGNKIKIHLFEDNSIEIQDFGRGLPMDYNKNEDDFNWKIALCKLHAGGKLKTDRSSYNSSAGQHGLGASVTQFSSEFFDITVKRDGYIYEMNFKKGLPVGELKKTRDKEKPQVTGTTIKWKPDADVFTDIQLDKDEVLDWIRLQAVVNKNVEFDYTDERFNIKETFLFENGIIDYAKQIQKDSVISDLVYFEQTGFGRDSIKRPTYEVKASIVFGFSENTENLYFHNSLPLEYGGSPKFAMEDAFIQFFASKLKTKSDLKFEDIKDNLIFISATSTQVPPSFENQTKKAISNKFIREFLTNQILIQLDKWSKDCKMEYEKVCNQITVNHEARASAANHKILTKQKLTKNINGMKNKIPNFVDCRTKDISKKELFIVEGNSAGGSIKQARNPDTQALIPLRGKIKSVYKISQADALSSLLIKQLIQLIGTGIDTKTTKCEVENINFGKIIFACFTGDTKIKSFGGKDYSFNELIENNIKNLWVYSRDKRGKMVPGYAHSIRKTGEATKLVHITLDNNEVIKCTVDHRFLDVDGKEVEAQDLTIGKSLSSLHLKTDKHTINYKVVNIDIEELDTPIDVFCMTVDEHHNFVLSSGVFVKNCDQDEDAKHIISLLLTLFYTFMPAIIEAGLVYELKTPLFEIIHKDGTIDFAYNEQEKVDLLAKHKNVKIERNKGLGQISAEQMTLCLKDDTRRLIQYTLDDAKKAKEYMDLFMGSDASVRKSYIEEHMHLYDIEV